VGEPEVLGLIAGEGAFPVEVARSAGGRGLRVACVALRGQADPRLEDHAWQVTWIHPGEVAAGLAAFRAAGVRQAVMVGKVTKSLLYGDPDALRLDRQATSLMGELADRRDDTILGRAADFLEAVGIRLLPQHAFTPELLVRAGTLTRAAPTPEQAADVAFGLPVAKAIGELDIGQTVVVKDRAVLAVEAIEGTDEAIRRGGRIAPGACVVKVAKPRQDPRFDVPTVGPRTIATLAEARVAVLAVEAGATVVLEREALVRDADAAGIVVMAVDSPRAEPA